MDTFKTLVIPDDCVELARQLCALEAGGAGMFTTGLSADGKAPATHYISSGFCPPLIAQYTPTQVWEMQGDAWVLVDTIPGNPVAVYDASQAAAGCSPRACRLTARSRQRTTSPRAGARR